MQMSRVSLGARPASGSGGAPGCSGACESGDRRCRGRVDPQSIGAMLKLVVLQTGVPKEARSGVWRGWHVAPRTCVRLMCIITICECLVQIISGVRCLLPAWGPLVCSSQPVSSSSLGPGQGHTGQWRDLHLGGHKQSIQGGKCRIRSVKLKNSNIRRVTRMTIRMRCGQQVAIKDEQHGGTPATLRAMMQSNTAITLL
jgi:hypothetical protein